MRYTPYTVHEKEKVLGLRPRDLLFFVHVCGIQSIISTESFLPWRWATERISARISLAIRP